jgi:hypothetical protein
LATRGDVDKDERQMGLETGKRCVGEVKNSEMRVFCGPRRKMDSGTTVALGIGNHGKFGRGIEILGAKVKQWVS